MKQKTLVFVFGTRPELIKMIPLIKESQKQKDIKTIVCSTGQHKDMLASLYVFFGVSPDIDFKLMKPNQSLSGLHAETMMQMLNVINEHKPDWVIVQGDTTSAHAAAMAAFYQKINVAHVEAGLRTYDIHSPFPEEMNRRAIGLVAKAHLCPTKEAAANLQTERIDASSFIETTGNTGIDTLKIVENILQENRSLNEKFSQQFKYVDLNNFILATMHRRENFGDAQKQVLKAFLNIVLEHKIDILFPVHPNPNVRQSVQDILSAHMNKNVFWVSNDNQVPTPAQNVEKGRIFLIDPLDYTALVFTMKKCRFVMTDSGGLQEEAPTFGKKILVLRNSTERPEGVAAGFSNLVGTDYDKIVQAANQLIKSDKYWTTEVPQNPYGDGRASERIIKILKERS